MPDEPKPDEPEAPVEVEVPAAATEKVGTILPPGDHYVTDQFGTLHTRVRTYPPTVTVSAYASTAAAFSAPEQQAAVLALEPKLEALPDMVLVAIGHGEEPAGPHLGNPNLPEGTLKPLAANELTRRKGARETRRWIIGTCIGGPLLVILGWALSLFMS